MTLPRYYKLLEHWRQYPPVHISVAAYIGIGKGRPSDAPAGPAESLIDQFAM